MIIIYTTHENQERAKILSDILLGEKLIACYNVFPIESCYWWQGSITRTGEIGALLKTKKENWGKVKKRILELHSYDTPCILKIEVEANESYEEWLGNEVKDEKHTSILPLEEGGEKI